MSGIDHLPSVLPSDHRVAVRLRNCETGCFAITDHVEALGRGVRLMLQNVPTVGF